MTIATYAELKTAIAGWLKRDDLTAQIPDFIRLAESRINTLSMLRPQEVETSLTSVPSVDTVSLPSDYKSPLALWLVDINPRQRLDMVLPTEQPYTTTPSRPLYWSIDGTNLRFQAPADGAYPLKFRYEQKFALSDSTATNYLLTNYPDVYLFGSLVEAFSYALDEQRSAVWDNRFNAAMTLCNEQESANDKLVPLRTEFANLQQRRFNINRGY